jgi:hypothetical protein
MDKTLFVSLLAAILNSLMSIVVPCIMNKTKFPSMQLMDRIKKRFESRKSDIMSSSLTTFVVVYVSLMVSENLDKSMIGGNLRNLSNLRLN